MEEAKLDNKQSDRIFRLKLSEIEQKHKKEQQELQKKLSNRDSFNQSLMNAERKELFEKQLKELALMRVDSLLEALEGDGQINEQTHNEIFQTIQRYIDNEVRTKNCALDEDIARLNIPKDAAAASHRGLSIIGNKIKTLCKDKIDSEIRKQNMKINFQKANNVSETKKPKWWIAAILAPIIVGLVITLINTILQKSTESKYGELYIECNLDSAEVYLNKELKGLTSSSEILRLESLKPGNYVLNVRKTDYHTLTDEKIKITAWEITTKTVNLSPILQYNATSSYSPKNTVIDSSNSKKIPQSNLNLDEDIYNSTDPAVANTLANLALLNEAQGKYNEAENIWKRVLYIQEKAYSKEHPEFAQTLNSIASLYIRIGKYNDAETYLLQALTIFEKAYGSEHPIVATSLNNLASVYLRIAKYDKAAPLIERALEIRRRSLGQDHPDLIPILENLLVIYKRSGNSVKVNSILEEINRLKQKFN